MNFPKEKIVDFAECNEMFPSPLIEKVSQLLINLLDFKLLFKGVYRVHNNSSVSTSSCNGEYLVFKLSLNCLLEAGFNGKSSN